MSTDWHASPGQLAAFADGALGPVRASSVEAHLVVCDDCRAELSAQAESAHGTCSDRMWTRITDEIDSPRRNLASRWTWARVTLGSPPLAAATVLVLIALVVVPLLAGEMDRRAGAIALIGLAPLAPVLGAAVAFRPALDPAGQLSAATPLATMRLVLLRALVVTIAALPVGIAVAVVLPLRSTLLLGWVLPGLALCAIVLAAGSRFDPTRLAIALALGWAVLVSNLGLRTRDGDLTARLSEWVVNHPATQLTSAGIAAGVVIVLVARRDAAVNWRMS